MALTAEQSRLAAKFLHSKGYRATANGMGKIAKPYPLDDMPNSDADSDITIELDDSDTVKGERPPGENV